MYELISCFYLRHSIYSFWNIEELEFHIIIHKFFTSLCTVKPCQSLKLTADVAPTWHPRSAMDNSQGALIRYTGDVMICPRTLGSLTCTAEEADCHQSAQCLVPRIPLISFPCNFGLSYLKPFPLWWTLSWPPLSLYKLLDNSMYAEVILPQVRLQVDLKKEMNSSAPSLFHSIK